MDFKQIYDIALELLTKLQRSGYKAYFVGGYVRDKIIGDVSKVTDIDIVTNATVAQIRKLFHYYTAIQVGEAFNIAIIVINKKAFEIATFRADGPYSDGRHPDSVSVGDIHSDALRRDFTINGLYFDPNSGILIDLIGGVEDIHNKIIRTIGSPIERFNEDYLRMIRAIRFAAQKNFSIDKDTFSAIQKLSHKIIGIAKERIKTELEKLFLAECDISFYLSLLDQSKLFFYLTLHSFGFEEGINDESKVAKEKEMMFSNMSKSERNLIFRWSILIFHVIRIISSFKCGERDVFSDIRISQKFLELAESFMQQLKFDNKMKYLILWIFSNFENLKSNFNTSQVNAEKIKLIAHPWSNDLISVFSYICNSLTYINNLKYQYHLIKESLLADVDKTQQLQKFTLISGHDLLKLGFHKGKQVGDVLEQVKDLYYTSQLNNRDEIIEYLYQQYPEYTSTRY